jgi:multiple sugar transport system substrate-binding protein
MKPCKIKLLSLLAASVLSLGGCQQESKPDVWPDGTVVIEFWNGFSGPDGAAMEAIVRKFNKEHPKIQVRMQIIPWGTYYDKVTLGLAFGGAPDVFVLHANRFPEFASHNALSPIDSFAQNAGLRREAFVEKAWDAGIWKGTQYALPLDVHPLGLYYNKKLFTDAGIPGPPKTLEEFVDTAKRLTKDKDGDGKIDQWGFSFTWLHSNSYLFLNQFDTGLLTKDQKRSALASPQALQALDLMEEMIHKHKIAPTPEGNDAWMGFQTGKVAMALEGVYMKTGLDKQKDLDYAGVAVPQFGPKQAVWAGSHMMSMPRKLSPRRQEAAWTFIKYLSDNSLTWAEGGQIPVRKQLLESPEFRKMEVQFAMSKQIPYIEYEPASVSYNQVATYGDSAVEKCLNTNESCLEALKIADRRINTVLERE